MKLASTVMIGLLNEVVVDHVFSASERDRGSGPLDEKNKALINTGERIDRRSPKLTTISGKGGWSEDQNRTKEYAAFTNVTLLDHSVSVARGAMVFAEMDLRERGVEEDAVAKRLATIAAVGFLHDADKMLGLARSEAQGGKLNETAIDGLMTTFGIHAFLERRGVSLSAKNMIELVNGIEITTVEGMTPVPREAWSDRLYVRLADRIEGAFLQSMPLPGRPHFGIEGALRELESFQGLRLAGARSPGWRIIDIRDPHTPFLLNAFQQALSAECQDAFGFPPMIEMHHDGRLLVVLPSTKFDQIVKQALGRVTIEIGASIRISTNARGKIDLLDAPGEVTDVRNAIASMRSKEQEGVLRGSKAVLEEHADAIEAFLRPSGFLTRTPDLANYPGKLVPLWIGSQAGEDHAKATQRDAILLGTILACTDRPTASRVPGAEIRENELWEILAKHGPNTGMPEFIRAMPDDTRRAITSGYAAGMAQEDADLHDAIYGKEGILSVWLEGRANRPGLASTIDQSGIRLKAAVERHYGALLRGELVTSANESDEGRCHFTNAPVPRSTRIDGKTGLYGLNVSAFSGRDGRPESFKSAAAETLVSPVAEAEHKLRQIQFQKTGQSSAGRRIPIMVTSPTTAGLFGALAFNNDTDTVEFSLADIARTKIEGDRPVFRNAEAALRRTNVARFEDFPDRLTGSGKAPGQIAFVRMAINAAQRTGRPVHAFRGLPSQRPEFVVLDAMPESLTSLLGGNAFRLEQLPNLVERLNGLESIVEATGFGLELGMRVCDPATRFGAACEGLSRAERKMKEQGKSNDMAMAAIRRFTINLLENDSMPSRSNTAIVDFGCAMARVQRMPRREDGDNRVELGIKTALNTVEALERLGQTSSDSMLAGIAGEIEKEIARAGLYVRKEIRGGMSISQTIEAAAKVFVDGVWRDAFKQAVPSSRDRRVAFAVYRHAFKTTSAALYSSTKPDADEAKEEMGEVA